MIILLINYSLIIKKEQNKLYIISLNEKNEIIKINFCDIFFENFKICGYMLEKLSSSISSDNLYYSDSYINKVIIYGKDGQNLYFFSYNEKKFMILIII